MTYAKGTTVAVGQSRAELEKILSRYGADVFGYGQDERRAIVTFRANERHIRFELPLPSLEDFKWKGRFYNDRTRKALPEQREQKIRELWRGLLLVVKAKLEAVESGIESFEQAFLPYIVLPDGSTAGGFLLPQVAEAYRTGEMPSLLPGGRPTLESGAL